MIANVDRRQEPRLRYSWESQLYCDDIRGGRLARMVDLNSKGAAILVENDCPFETGKEVEIGLMYPKVINGNFEIIHEHRPCTVIRNEWYNSALNRIVVQFHLPMEQPPAVGNEYINN